MDTQTIQKEILQGDLVLGIELGSTRIKSVLVGRDHKPVAVGSYQWENRLENGIWTYPLEEVWTGLQESYGSCVKSVEEKYGCGVEKLACIGISAMMHGYLVFDREDRLLVPFRTWRNTITKEAAEKLTELFEYNIPQRWNIAHLYQAILNGEEHVCRIASMMTLDSYVHWQLTGRKVTGIGDASGMFPIDIHSLNYDEEMIRKFNCLDEVRQLPWKLEELLPRPLTAGEDAGTLTERGARMLDPSGFLKPGCRLCPPEGDAQTGMMATNSVKTRTGNISAGTSDFAILVLEREPSKVYPEIDLVTSPTGKLAANIHSNNFTSDINAWTGVFKEFAEGLGCRIGMDELYAFLYQKALEGEKDCGGLLSYNYYSGEGITKLDSGMPLIVRTPDSRLNLKNLMRTHLFSAMATLKIGMDIITEKEGMQFDRIMGHGGFFKTEFVGQKLMAAAFDMPITVMKTANEGGAWGIALLAQYAISGQEKSLEEWIDQEVFGDEKGVTVEPDEADVNGFRTFIARYKRGLSIEREAAECRWEI